MDGMRVLSIFVEVDSRRLGGSMLLLPFAMRMRGQHPIRVANYVLLHVLFTPLDRPTALAIAEHIKMFCSKQQVVT